jgi:hypothetical protein
VASMLRVRTVLSGFTGGPGLNTFYFLTDTSPGTSDADAVLGRVRGLFAAINANFPPSMQADTSEVVDVLADVDGSLLDSLVGTPASPVVGTSSVLLGADQAMVGIRIGTATIISGRRVSGRSFVGPLRQDAFVDGNLGSGTESTFQDGIDALLVGDSLHPLCVWHRPSGPGAGDGQAVPNSTVTLAPRAFTLRSRAK